MNRVFLVDTENISRYNFMRDYTVGFGDIVYLFYSKRSNCVHLNFIRELIESDAFVDFIEVECDRPNALDFELSTFLGMMVKEHSTDMQYYIVSNDKGYTSTIELINKVDKNINVRLLEVADSEVTCCLSTLELGELLYSYKLGSLEIAYIKSLIDFGTTCRTFHNALVKRYGGIVGKEIYSVLKKVCFGR